MNREQALEKWTHCAKVGESKGNFFAEENDGLLARKLMPYPAAVIEEVKLTAGALWPSGRYTAVVKVTHVPATPGVTPAPPLRPVAGKPGKWFYLAVRKADG